MIPKAVHRSPGIYLTAEENTAKPQLEDRHRLKWGPLPPNEVGRIAQPVRKGKEGKDGNNKQSILVRIELI